MQPGRSSAVAVMIWFFPKLTPMIDTSEKRSSETSAREATTFWSHGRVHWARCVVEQAERAASSLQNLTASNARTAGRQTATGEPAPGLRHAVTRHRCPSYPTDGNINIAQPVDIGSEVVPNTTTFVTLSRNLSSDLIDASNKL